MNQPVAAVSMNGGIFIDTELATEDSSTFGDATTGSSVSLDFVFGVAMVTLGSPMK